jgi:hypothetical protein
MPSPSSIRDFPHQDGTMTVSGLVGDDKEELTAHIIQLAKNEDDPPIIFGWNDAGLEAFWNKATLYGATQEAINPPIQINRGNHVVGQCNGTNLQQLKVDIINYLRSKVNPPPTIVGGTACLACTQNQMCHVCIELMGMNYNPWIVAVLGHGPPLTQTLASIWHPRPNNRKGECLRLTIPTLWT